MNLPFETLLPALILCGLLMMLVAVLFWAQVNPNSTFDVANFLRDESGKESSGRAFSFIALAIHCWWVTTLVFQKAATLDHFLWFGVIWSGAPVMMVLAQRWAGNLPLAQPGHPPSDRQ